VPAIGITGGISTGKTTFCECLQAVLPGALIFNADRAARELVDHDEMVKGEIRRAFGAAVYSPIGDLNRAALRAMVFNDAAQRRVLEEILHPRIRRQWSAIAQTHRQPSDFFFADIPLLFETGGESLCDLVVVVACSPGLPRHRLMVRSRLSAEQADEMIRSQMPLSEKMGLAQHVVWNNDGPAALRGQASLLAQSWRNNS
jgi:dephospho-CoA kinase